jgi:ankyrin repeat protein
MSAESRAIVRAIESGDLDTAGRLCREHRDQLLASGELQYLFKYAASSNQIVALDLLHNAGALVNAPLDKYTDQTALFSATANGAAEGVRWLLAHAATINQDVKGEVRCLSLFVAIRLGHADIVRQLVEAGAVTRTIWNGQTPVECATAHGHTEIARYLESQDVEPLSRPTDLTQNEDPGSG